MALAGNMFAGGGSSIRVKATAPDYSGHIHMNVYARALFDLIRYKEKFAHEHALHGLYCAANVHRKITIENFEKYLTEFRDNYLTEHGVEPRLTVDEIQQLFERAQEHAMTEAQNDYPYIFKFYNKWKGTSDESKKQYFMPNECMYQARMAQNPNLDKISLLPKYTTAKKVTEIAIEKLQAVPEI